MKSKQMYRRTRAFPLFSYGMILGVLLLVCLPRGNAAKEAKEKNASAPVILESEQQTVIKKETLQFLRDHSNREAGEGLLFLARQARELGRNDKAKSHIQNIVRADKIALQWKCEAQLLLADILKDEKEFDLAIKELDRLLSWSPERAHILKAKKTKAEILGRGLTRIEDLFKAYQRYFSKFPEANEKEELTFLMGFERGYDLEIAMKGLEAWEEIASFPEREFSDDGHLHVGLFYAYDLNNPSHGLAELEKIRQTDARDTEAAINALFVRAALTQFHLPSSVVGSAEGLYQQFRSATANLFGYRVATVMLGQLLAESLHEPARALDVFAELATAPASLQATASVSLKKRQDLEEEDRGWAIKGYKMAGFTAEFKMNDPDRARPYYEKAAELEKKEFLKKPDFWLVEALARTAPKLSQAQIHFDKAYEKYRGREFPEALSLFETFIASYPQHQMTREAKYRIAIMMDDDFKDYDKALDLYHQYALGVLPQKSQWTLDKIYDWGRSDEVRYRIGNLLALHRKDYVGALKAFEELQVAYPDSYWGSQGLKDTIRIRREILGDEKGAQEATRLYIKNYPDSKDAQKYRKDLMERMLAENKNTEALTILRNYLDHSSPSEKEYLEMKKKWRDLSYRIREEAIRARLQKVGGLDRIELFEALIPVLSLASSSEPLEAFAKEISNEDIPDDTRWNLTYKLGTSLYREYPDKAKSIFEELAATATGPVKLACILTLGNLAYRVEKSIPNAIRLYETAASMASPIDLWLEAPQYRLGRLYLASGDGAKGIAALEKFIRRYPQSRYLGKALLTLGEAFAVLHNPAEAKRLLLRAGRLSPALFEKANKLYETLVLKTETSETWLKKQALDRGKSRAKESILAAGRPRTPGSPFSQNDNPAAGEKGASASISLEQFDRLDPAKLYANYLEENAKPQPKGETLVPMLLAIMKKGPTGMLAEKTVKHYISWRFFRQPTPDKFITEAQDLLTKNNYPEIFSEILYRLALAREVFKKDFEKANKSYFEYLSFFPNGKRVMAVRERIPQVYEYAKDNKNALRFFTKLIEDQLVPMEMKIEASVRKAKIEEVEERKEEAIRTLEACLAYDSPRRPEIFLRLERLTENADYVQKALDAPGEEKSRLLALKRLVKKAEEAQDFLKAESLIKNYGKLFTDIDGRAWLTKKGEDLGKRGSIKEMEDKVEMFPEEIETPSRLFKLANLVEGVENTKYQSQDLFYEITLLYPGSEFFKESKIRADNLRATKSINAMNEILKKGVKEDGEEILLERARLFREALQAPAKAQEDYEALLKLFPESPRHDEAYLGLGEIALSMDHDADKALNFWEIGLSACKDPQTRQDLISRINDLKMFKSKILESDKPADHEEAERIIYRIWRLEGDPQRALGLIQEALGKIENRPHYARFQYLSGIIFEDLKKDVEAFVAYEKALRSLYHPGCRKDRLLYRMARIKARSEKKEDAYPLYTALITRYPQSRFCRSAYYWLYKQDLVEKKTVSAHDRLTNLLRISSLAPVHRQKIRELLKDLEICMNIEELARLQNFSDARTRPTFHYFIAKVLENDLRDYDGAIREYQAYLNANPPVTKARTVMIKMADLAERKADYVQAAAFLDNVLKTLKPARENLDLIIRLGNLLEDRLANQELTNLFYDTIAGEYAQVPEVKTFARAKMKRIVEKRMAKAAKPKAARKAKREYDDADQEILDQLDDILTRIVDDMQDYPKAEREMIALWEENKKSPATLDIMKALVSLNEDQLLDPQKGAEYAEQWLEENPDDSEYGDQVMKLYDLYMDRVKDGQKALHLLDNFTRNYPGSPLVMEAQIKLGKANELLVMNWDEARRIYQRIIDTKQNHPIVHEAYFRMGFVLREGFADYTNAIKIWDELINLFYQNAFAADAQFAIGYTYEAFQRDYAKAREAYEKILNLYPNSPLQNKVREALLRISGK